jgi:hypothetical protein
MNKKAITKLSEDFDRVQRDLDAFKKASRPDAEIDTLQHLLDVGRRSLEHLQEGQSSGHKMKAKGAKKKAA